MAEAIFIDVRTDETEGVWFPHFSCKVSFKTGEIEYGDPIETKNPEDCPGMWIRDPAPFFEERRKKQKTKTKYVVNPQTRAMNPVKEPVDPTEEEERRESDDYADYVIEKFQNYKVKGKVLPCNRNNKIILMKNSAIKLYVHRCVEILQESSVKEEREETKNLPSGSSSRKTRNDPA